MIRRAICKFFFFLTLSAIFWTGILDLKKIETLAYFSDSENNQSNSFTAGPLDFSLDSLQDFDPADTCQESHRDIKIVNHGNPFRYKIETTSISGDLCNYIVLDGNLDGGPSECTTNLVGFNCEVFSFSEPAGSDPHQWHFTATLIEGAPEGAVCNFKFLYSGWQINLDTGGFHDEEEIENTITSGICPPTGPKIIINKVYYDVDAKHGTEITNEWLELYNPNDMAVDISGWLIEDNSSQSIIPVSPSLPAQGFALITGNNSTWQYWESVPSSAVRIVLAGGKIGNGLANDGDRLLLKLPTGQIIDQMSYEGDISVFNPAPPLNSSGNTYDLPEGHILGRKPTGFDTDSASDWHDFGLPQVTVTSPTGGSWYCGKTYTLKWTATNPNGPNSDLKITLLYIRDLDKNGVISSGDAVTLIAKDIANTDSYNWKVSPCYTGYVWIKVIAKGPENFIISGSGLSGRVYEPTDPMGESGQSEEELEQGNDYCQEITSGICEIIVTDEILEDSSLPEVIESATATNGNATGTENVTADNTATLENTTSSDQQALPEAISDNSSPIITETVIEEESPESNSQEQVGLEEQSGPEEQIGPEGQTDPEEQTGSEESVTNMTLDNENNEPEGSSAENSSPPFDGIVSGEIVLE